jgi:hypothetical protein
VERKASASSKLPVVEEEVAEPVGREHALVAGVGGGAKPRTVPLVINLRQDPFEVTMDSKMYTRWYGDKLWVMLPAQAIEGQFLQTFKEFPQRQKSSTINVDRILMQMQKRDN